MVDHEAAVDAQFDETRIAKGVALGLPIVTVGTAVVVGVVFGPATSILVLTAGMLLGVIALLWGSLRILSGDAPLSPELEALDMAAQSVDALAGRKKMLLRALKDLENEHGIGKIEDEDFEQLSSTYRTELKIVLKRIDESLAPHRAKAEALAREQLLKAGLFEEIKAPPTKALPERAQVEVGAAAEDPIPRVSDTGITARLGCPKCGASNEKDAKFCKECATKLVSSTSSLGSTASTFEVEETT